MAHELDMSNGRANMAYVGEMPWHGLGQRLDENQDIDQWRVAAGLDWKLEERSVMYRSGSIETGEGELCIYPSRKILTRSDTGAALSCVGDSYRVVQPGEVLEFYRDIVSTAGFKLHTAGVLRGGRKYWALAKINEEARIMGQDKVEGYVLLVTACDGSLATRAMFTSVRVVCANTLGYAVTDADGSSRPHIRVPHSREFKPEAVKAELGLSGTSWNKFADDAFRLASRKVSEREAVEWLVKVFGDANKPVEEQQNTNARVMRDVLSLFQGGGRGSDLRSAANTAWGLVNAATEYCDHHSRCRTADSRLDRAWFGDGATIKRKAWDNAMALAA